MSELIEISSVEGTYSYDLTGYIETSYINITAGNVDDYVNNADYIDINAGATATATADIDPDNPDHGLAYKCHIDLSGMFEIDFNLPNFLSVPAVNLTLFKKMNEFSRQISDLNDNMIAFIQSANCCEMSYEYNKTVVPIFRYLADHPDTEGCNILDPEVKEDDTCAYNNDENFMSEILKVIREITKVYTAIEPIFCIIKPIPGNPWLPMDFNWIRPILPYIEKFGKFSEKIMSGELIDVVIDPIKDINRNLFNCRQENKNIALDKTISSTVIINSIQELDNVQDFNAAVEELNNEAFNIQSTALTTLEKYSDTKDFINEYKTLGTIIDNKNKQEEEKDKLLNGYQTELEAISTKMNLVQSERDKIAAYYQKEGNKPLQCLREILTFRPELPKLPWITITLLPRTGSSTHLRNDLTQVIDEKAYDITYADVYGETGDWDNRNIDQEKIRFGEETVYNAEFIKKFRTYINDNGEDRNYKKAPSSFAWEDYLLDDTLTAESFNTDTLDSSSDYFTNSTTLEGVLDRDYEDWDNAAGTFVEISGNPEAILTNNSLIADEIAKIQLEEAIYVKKLQSKTDEDKRNWSEYRLKAKSILDSIKANYRRETEAIEDTTAWNDWDWWDYTVRDFNSVTVEQAELTFWSTFGNYQEIDIIKDPSDETNTDGYNMYTDLDGNPELLALQGVVNTYIIDRKNLLGDIAKQEFNKQVESFTIKADLLKSDLITVQDEFYYRVDQLRLVWKLDAADGITRKVVLQLPAIKEANTEYATIFSFYDKAAEFFNEELDENYHVVYNRIVNNSVYTKEFRPSITLLSSIYKEIIPGVFVYKNYSLMSDVDSTPQELLDQILDKLISSTTNLLELDGATSSANNIEGYILRIFKYERIKKEYFVTINKNVAYKFYVIDNPEITLSCSIICELIQFIINYLLAIIKKLLMMLIYWLIDYLVPDWLKNVIRLILYKLKCFLMMAYNVSTDEDTNRMLKIDNTYDSFMESIRNRVNLYPYDACAKTALEEATAEAAETNDETSDATNDTIINAAIAHDVDIYFANADLSALLAISRYNYEDIKIVIKKDSLATVSNIIIRDYEDTLTGPSAVDLTSYVLSFDPTSTPTSAESSADWFVSVADNGDVIINNLNLDSLTTALTMVSIDSYKSTADETTLYSSHIVSNRFSSLTIPTGIIQLQDNETKSFLTLLDSNKQYLKILFKEETGSDIISIELTDNTPYVTAAVATATSEEILASTPLTKVSINLEEYEIQYDSIYNLSFFIYDCSDFFPAGNDITGRLTTMFNGVQSTVDDSILCKIDDTTVGSTSGTTEELVINDTLITSAPVTNPGVNPDPVQAAELIEDGVSQSRTETPIIFDCTNSNGTITELLIANYESWIALGLIPDPTI